MTALPIMGLGSPSGIAVDGNNTVYVADKTNNVIVSYTAAGVQGTVTTTSLSGPMGLAVDGLGGALRCGYGQRQGNPDWYGWHRDDACQLADLPGGYYGR